MATTYTPLRYPGGKSVYAGLLSDVIRLNNLENVNVSLYPNPATTFMNIKVNAEEAQQFSAKVVDMMGKTVYVDQFDHNGGTSLYQIPVDNLAKGVYFLHLNNSNGSTVQKFIVE